MGDLVQFVPKPHPQRQLGPVSPLAAQVKQELDGKAPEPYVAPDQDPA